MIGVTSDLNDRIEHEFTTGWAGVTIINAQIHAQGQTIDSIQALPLEEKRDWLKSVDAGRKSLRAPTATGDATDRMRELMRDFLARGRIGAGQRQ